MVEEHAVPHDHQPGGFKVPVEDVVDQLPANIAISDLNRRTALDNGSLSDVFGCKGPPAADC